MIHSTLLTISLLEANLGRSIQFVTSDVFLFLEARECGLCKNFTAVLGLTDHLAFNRLIVGKESFEN